MSLALNPFRELSVEIDGVTTLVEAIILEVKINDELMLFVLIEGTVRGPVVVKKFVVNEFVVIEFVQFRLLLRFALRHLFVFCMLPSFT